MIDSLSMQWTKLLDFLWNSITNIDSSYRMIMKIYVRAVSGTSRIFTILWALTALISNRLQLYLCVLHFNDESLKTLECQVAELHLCTDNVALGAQTCPGPSQREWGQAWSPEDLISTVPCVEATPISNNRVSRLTLKIENKDVFDKHIQIK